VSRRIALVHAADNCQFPHFLLVIILPLRPKHYASLLVSEVELDGCQLRFSSRLGGRDFDKGFVFFLRIVARFRGTLLHRVLLRRIPGVRRPIFRY
jgi:hypothetical protein